MDNDKAGIGEFGFSKPAVYRIKVLGELTEDSSLRLRGMKVVVTQAKGAKPVSEIIGGITDQSALQGIFSFLYDMHLPVLSVDIIDDELKQ